MTPYKVRTILTPLALGLSLWGCAAFAQTAPKPHPAASKEVVTNSGMTPELFFVLLLAEINLQSGNPGAGHSLLYEAARKSNDTALYQRAIQTSPTGDAALQVARAWRQAQPNTRAANRTVLQLLVALNRVTDSLEPLKTELAMASPQDLPLAIATVPRYYQEAKDKKQAAHIVEQALAEYFTPNASAATFAAAWASVGRLRMQADDLSGAHAAAQKALSRDPSVSGAAILALELLNRKHPGAEQLVRASMAAGPAPEVRMAYARMLLDDRKYGDALKQLQSLTSEKPDFAEAWLVQGVVQAQEGQPAAGETSLIKYLDLMAVPSVSRDATVPAGEEKKRALSQAYLSLAQIAEERKDYKAAQQWLDKVEDARLLISAQSRRASLLAKQGKLDEGRKLLQSTPQDSEADARLKLMAEVSLLREYKDNATAYALLESAQARFDNDPDLQYEQAMVAEKLGNVSEMERLLEKLIATKPDYHQAYNALGFSLADRNLRLPEAKRLIKKALESAPDDPFILDSLGWVEFRLGNKAESLRILDAAYRARPDVEIAAHLGEVLWSMGQQARAMTIWREGQKINATNATLVETLKRLRIKL